MFNDCLASFKGQNLCLKTQIIIIRLSTQIDVLLSIFPFNMSLVLYLSCRFEKWVVGSHIMEYTAVECQKKVYTPDFSDDDSESENYYQWAR